MAVLCPYLKLKMHNINPLCEMNWWNIKWWGSKKLRLTRCSAGWKPKSFDSWMAEFQTGSVCFFDLDWPLWNVEIRLVYYQWLLDDQLHMYWWVATCTRQCMTLTMLNPCCAVDWHILICLYPAIWHYCPARAGRRQKNIHPWSLPMFVVYNYKWGCATWLLLLSLW